ncbi:MAG: LLM class flavin-dependent oxidoreductase [Gammaproteobacteria bacterium]
MNVLLNPALTMRYSIFSVQDHYPGQGREVAEFYQQVGAEAKLAEALGYDGFFVAEHHFHEYGVSPDPAVLLAALAAITTRIKLGSAIAVLPFHHPLALAERYAMVDVLSGGRLVLGVGSGYLAHEFAGFAIDPAEKRARFDENLAIVKRALMGERITFTGQFNCIDGVAINVLPIQKPLPPIYVAALRAESAYHIGKQGYPILAVPYAAVAGFSDIGVLVSDYQRGFHESGMAGRGDAIIMLHTHVAPTDAEARRRAAAAFDRYVASRLYARRQTYDDILASGLGLFGSVATVIDKMLGLYEVGVRHVMMLHNFGLLAPELVEHSMRLVAEEVMPRVEAEINARYLPQGIANTIASTA